MPKKKKGLARLGGFLGRAAKKEAPKLTKILGRGALVATSVLGGAKSSAIASPIQALLRGLAKKGGRKEKVKEGVEALAEGGAVTLGTAVLGKASTGDYGSSILESLGLTPPSDKPAAQLETGPSAGQPLIDSEGRIFGLPAYVVLAGVGLLIFLLMRR